MRTAVSGEELPRAVKLVNSSVEAGGGRFSGVVGVPPSRIFWSITFSHLKRSIEIESMRQCESTTFLSEPWHVIKLLFYKQVYKVRLLQTCSREGLGPSTGPHSRHASNLQSARRSCSPDWIKYLTAL